MNVRNENITNNAKRSSGGILTPFVTRLLLVFHANVAPKSRCLNQCVDRHEAL